MRAFDSTKGLSYVDRAYWQRTEPDIPKPSKDAFGCNKTVTCLYVIGKHSKGPVKIGISHDPKARARSLETYESFFVFDGFWFDSKEDAHEAEGLAHKRLKKQGAHANKEWFNLGVQDAVSFLENLCDEFGDRFVYRGTKLKLKIRKVGVDGKEKLM